MTWGPNLKAMVSKDILWVNKQWDGIHIVYPPFAGIIEYFFCKLNGSYSEGVAYIAINTFMITSILPVFSNLKCKFSDIKKLIIYLGITIFIIILFGFQLNSIYVDLLLGIVFSNGLFLSFRLSNKEDKISLLLICICLPLIKDSGLLLVGIILLQLFIRYIIIEIIINKKIEKKVFYYLIVIFGILVITLVSYASWKIYCHTNGRQLDFRHDNNSISEFDIKEFIGVITLQETADNTLLDITTNFYLHLLYNAPTLKVLAAFNIIGILFFIINLKNILLNKKILASLFAMNIGFILYCLLLLATYTFAMSRTEGLTLASYTRYMGSFFIAWGLFFVSIFMHIDIDDNVLRTPIFITFCVYIIILVFIIYFQTKLYTYKTSDIIKNQTDIILKSVTPDKKVFIVYQETDGFSFHELRYNIAPIVTNLLFEWNLMNQETSIGEIYTKEEFENKLILEDFDYVFLGRIDNRFVEQYKDLINLEITDTDYTQILTNKLLKVKIVNEDHVLLELNKDEDI